MNVKEILITKKEHPVYGRIGRIEMDDGSKIYISKKGLNLCVSKNSENMAILKNKKEIELNISFEEIKIAIQLCAMLNYNFLKLK